MYVSEKVCMWHIHCSSTFCFRVDMIKSLDGSFKGMWLIDTLRDTIRGAIGKPSSPTCDITELIKFSKVKESGCFKL